ncbi:MAG: NAD-dependent epimerase/dehydratase family protein [Candidatus Babeliales bacterium]|jgi:dTDP-4-dehydrorhamnose reductase
MKNKLITTLLAMLLIIKYGSCVTDHQPKTFLVFGGKTGWFGQKIVQLLKDKKHNPMCATSRLENRSELIAEIETIRPDFIINAAGITGRPNVDWCENHKQEILRTNVLGTLNLVDVAFLYGIPVTNLTTGCIYSYNSTHPMGSGIGFKEEEEPNSLGAFYARTKILLEKLILEYPNVLNLRIKMPVSSDMNPRSFIGKIIRFKKVVNLPNSISVLDDLFPIAIEMTLRGFRGNYNFANPGTMSHNEMLDLYKEYIDPNFTYQNFTPEEQREMSKNRSNCQLDVSKLLRDFNIPHVKEAVIAMLKNVRARGISGEI